MLIGDSAVWATRVRASDRSPVEGRQQLTSSTTSLCASKRLHPPGLSSAFTSSVPHYYSAIIRIAFSTSLPRLSAAFLTHHVISRNPSAFPPLPPPSLFRQDHLPTLVPTSKVVYEPNLDHLFWLTTACQHHALALRIFMHSAAYAAVVHQLNLTT